VAVLYRDGRLVTTAGVAVRDGRFFLARRKPGGAQSERWEFPGGKCDHGDLDEQTCLAREFYEEFSVDIAVREELGSVSFEHRGIPYLLVAYRVDFLQIPTELYEHTAAGWFTESEMRTLDLAESDRKLIEAWTPPISDGD
jgi:8-oxo-dGTP diphosphatase